MKIVHEISLDLVDQAEVPRIRVKQGDTYTRQVALCLTADGEPWTIPDDASAVIRYRFCGTGPADTAQGIYDTLPDGTLAWEAADNTVTVTLVPQITAQYGTVQADVAFIQGDGILATCNFEIYVNQSPATGAETEAQSYYNVITLDQINAQFQVLTERCQALDQEKLNISGGDLLGELCMTEHLITRVADPEQNDHAANKFYVDTCVAQVQENVDALTPDTTLRKAGVPADSATVGKALAERAMNGYGLGDPQALGADELDEVTSTGWYTAAGVTLGAYSFDGIYMRVDSYDDQYCLQTAYPMDGTMTSLQRFCVAGTWQDWDWVHPPMALGVEYRTAERWQGKPVYVKIVNFGVLPNSGTKTASLNLGASRIISLEGIASGSAALAVPFPVCGLDMLIHAQAWITSGGVLTVITDTDMTGYIAVFTVKYVK